jgi:hypothetical protein
MLTPGLASGFETRVGQDWADPFRVGQALHIRSEPGDIIAPVGLLSNSTGA